MTAELFRTSLIEATGKAFRYRTKARANHWSWKSFQQAMQIHA
jgi:hypothetical protein